MVVAVIDTGVDYTHEDLAANMWKNPKEIPGNGVDDDGNGYIDDVYGIDRYFKDSDPKDDHGHGTHCSGIIGGRGNNGIGISGVAWTAKIMALKFMSTSGGSTSDAITCMEYALAIRAREGYRMIWSNSWGGGGFSQTLYDTILAAQNAGVIFVASAGNDGQDGDLYTHYPSAYNLDNIICVGASNRADTIPTWSNYGCSSVDIFAPGNEILSSLPSNTYNSWSGTSMACPQVSGAAAVIWTKRGPTFNWRKIKGIILNGAEDGQAPPVFSRKCVTEGRLNLQKSLASAITDDPAIFSVTPYVATWGDKITLTGVNFGTTGTLTFKGISFPPASIVSWSSTKIVTKVPSSLPRGFGRLTVTNAGGTSRGVCFDCEVLETIAGYTNLVHGWAASAQIGNDLWILGGGTYWGQTGLVEKYTLTSGRSVVDSAWMMPYPVTNAGAAAISGKIYVVGGLSWDTGGLYNTLQIFNPAAGTWSMGANLSVKIHQPAVVAYGGKLYVFGGNGEGGVLKSTYVYDPGTNSWSPKADMPMGAAYAGACLYGSNKIWVMGGFATSSFGSEQSIVQEYDPAANSWTSKPAMIKTRGGQGAVNYGTKIFCLHGSGGGTTGLKDSERCYAGVWMNDLYGSQPLYTPMAGRISDQIYSAAGFVYGSGGGYSRNVWKLTSP